jgi:hypothetical protein
MRGAKPTHFRVPIAILLGLSIIDIAARHLQGAINTRTALNQRLPFLPNKKADIAEHCS